MNILALDLGTKTGWCFGSSLRSINPKTIQLGTPSQIEKWSANGLLRACDPRIALLYETIRDFNGRIDLYVFEDVVFASTTYQAQLWASLRAAVWLAAHCRPEPSSMFLPVPVGTLKKFATGNGAADKQCMKEHAMRVAPDLCCDKDDNAIDAFFLWKYGLANQAEGVTI